MDSSSLPIEWKTPLGLLSRMRAVARVRAVKLLSALGFCCILALLLFWESLMQVADLLPWTWIIVAVLVYFAFAAGMLIPVDERSYALTEDGLRIDDHVLAWHQVCGYRVVQHPSAAEYLVLVVRLRGSPPQARHLPLPDGAVHSQILTAIARHVPELEGA